jgi:GNAT superfamily N-acetyltransferase
MMSIRKIREDDVLQLSDLFVSVFNEPPWSQDWKKEWAYERLSIIFKSYRFYGCLAEVDNHPVAAVLSRLGSFKGELELEIIENFVIKDEQRKGIGVALLNELKSCAKVDGIRCFVLQTGRDTYAKSFYLTYGFKAHEDNLLMSHEFRC